MLSLLITSWLFWHICSRLPHALALAMDAADRSAALRRALCFKGRRWLGPRASVRVRRAPSRYKRQVSRSWARALLKAWVAEHAGSGAPASAGWMATNNLPGADRAMEWLRDAIELPLASDTWCTSQARLIAASISHSCAVQRESLDAAADAAQDAMDAADAAREQSLKANFQVSEIQDLAALELEELCRDKRQEEWEDRLLVMGHAAVDQYSPLHDVPLSILLRSQRASGSRGCGDCGSRGGGESGASWGPRVSRNRGFALPAFHENVAPYAPPHVGISSMRFVPDLTSSRVPTRLTSRPKAAARIEI